MKEKELQKGLELKARYRIEKILGRGGFSITYLATDKRMNVPVTLKQYDMSKSLTGDEAIREAQLAAGFYDLEGIAAARDYFEEQGTFYIVMEYVDGINITDFVKSHGSMAGRDVLEKLRPILHSLSHIHEKGVIHRDISGDNLILSADGKLKLIDFGAARQQIQDGEKQYTLIYKRGFAPIEQCQSHGIQGPWTDVYAVCGTMYFMLTGIVPDDSVDRMIHDRVRPLGEFAGTGLTKKEAAAIMKGMAVEAKKRYSSVRDLYSELYDEELEQGESPPEANWTYGEARKMRKQNTTYLAQKVERFYRRKRRKRKYLPVAVLMILPVIATGFFLWKNTSVGNQPESTTAKPENESVGNQTTEKPAATPEGAKRVKVKNYQGQLHSDIQKELKSYQKKGLTLRVVKKYSAKRKGTVISQKPSAGSRYDSWKDVTLTLTVSKGKKPKSAPVQTAKPKQDNETNRNDKKKDTVTFHGSL